MPFRERMRKALGRETDELAIQKTKSNKESQYKVGEPMPQPKYGGKPNYTHQSMLRGYDLRNAFGPLRRKSENSEISPGNSRGPSRRGSAIDARKSMGHKPSAVGHIIESAEGDDDPANVGSSQVKPAERENFAAPNEASNAQPNANGHATPAPFDQDDLAKRLTQTQSGVGGQSQSPAIQVNGV